MKPSDARLRDAKKSRPRRRECPSLAESLAGLPEAARRRLIWELSEAEARGLLYDWQFWARSGQIAPHGDWTTWLILAGRGYGKTRAGAEFLRLNVEGSTPLTAPPGGARRIALVAETAADARDVMVEGASGILACSPPGRVTYQPSKRRLAWANGAIATLYNAVEPDQLRGPQHDLAWADELAKWRYAEETWDQLQFGLRVGARPRQCATTTPRPIKLLRSLVTDPGTVVTRGTTYDNLANLAPAFVERIIAKYEGTRLGRQELEAQLLDDLPGALWQRRRIDQLRLSRAPELARIVVAIDPAAGGGAEADETGIVVTGLGQDGHGYLLEDLSLRSGPERWGRVAVGAYHRWQADRVIGEVNNGGEMIEHVVRTCDPAVSYKAVHASRGKVIRAEPIAALYEQGRVHHVGGFPQLEDQMCAFTLDPEFDPRKGPGADRADALVWGLSELMLGRPRAAPKVWSA